MTNKAHIFQLFDIKINWILNFRIDLISIPCAFLITSLSYHNTHSYFIISNPFCFSIQNGPDFQEQKGPPEPEVTSATRPRPGKTVPSTGTRSGEASSPWTSNTNPPPDETGANRIWFRDPPHPVSCPDAVYRNLLPNSKNLFRCRFPTHLFLFHKRRFRCPPGTVSYLKFPRTSTATPSA